MKSYQLLLVMTTMIMMITKYQILAEQMRQHLQCLTPQIKKEDQRVRQKKVKYGKLPPLYRHLNVTGDLDLINLDRFNYTKNTEKRCYDFRVLEW